MDSIFGISQSHAIKDENSVISNRCVDVYGCFITMIHQLRPPDMMMIDGSGVLGYLDSLKVTLDLMSDRYIRC